MVKLKKKTPEKKGLLNEAKSLLDLHSDKSKLNGKMPESIKRSSNDSSPKSKDTTMNGEPPKKKKKLKKKDTNINGKSEKKIKKSKISVNLTPTQDDTTVPAVDESPEVLGKFSNFNISEQTIDCLEKKGVSYLFPIQIKTFDHIYNGKDVIGQARTGTGKTLAFAIPIVERLQRSDVPLEYGRSPRVIALAPTRELVIQINKDFKDISRSLSTLSVYGGTPYLPQERALRNGVDIVVGTPGRVLDHVEKSKLILSKVEHVILDEVDQMLDMGFADIVDEILKYAYMDREEQPQTLLFSATCPEWVQHTARKYMRPEETVRVDTIGSSVIRTATTVKHLSIRCLFSELKACIGDVVQLYSGKHGRALVFTDRKSEANQLVHCNSLQAQNAQVLHGDVEQKQREITLKAFRDGKIHCLVATNVAARGLDIPEVDLVVQTSPPSDIDSYIHRSGRTGRAGRDGVCICFFEPRHKEKLQKVERAAGIKFQQVGPPQPTDLIDSACNDAMKSIEAVSKKLVNQFLDSAKTVANETEGGALQALAAALAHMSGATELTSRSLLDAQPNRRTWLFSSRTKIFASSVFSALETRCSPEIRNLVMNLRMTTDEKSAVFDIPDSWTDEIRSLWKDTPYLTLKIASELPPLKDIERRRTFGGWSQTNYEGRNNFGNNYNRNRGRGRGGGWGRKRNHYL